MKPNRKTTPLVIAMTMLFTSLPSVRAADTASEALRVVPPDVFIDRMMEYEPVLFIQEEGESVATGKLLLTPSAKPRVFAPDQVTQFIEGKDYVWKPGSDTIELTSTTRIPFKTAAQMQPPKGSPHMWNSVLHFEGNVFHELQMQVSYKHTTTWARPEPAKPERLKRTLAKLKAKEPVTIVALGDSITEGFNASGWKQCEAPPYQPSYPQLVANILRDRFGSDVNVINHGHAGSVSSAGFAEMARLPTESPDLVTIAYGMNHGESAQAFEENLRKLRDAVQTACPGADIVLVAPMTGNPLHFHAEHFIGYRDALKNLQMENVALADVTSPWMELLKRKAFSDISGNNVNHPNDFGHRLYARVIGQLFPLQTGPAPGQNKK